MAFQHPVTSSDSLLMVAQGKHGLETATSLLAATTACVERILVSFL